jgi:hypothetical protein
MRTTIAALAVSILLGSVLPSPAQTLDRARALYAGAEYSEALAELVRLEDSVEPPAIREVLEYHALCLLALGRTAETEQAVQRLVLADPSYELNEVDSPPQLRAIFSSVRERHLPGLARQRYAAAKALLDSGENGAAAEAFEVVLSLLGHRETVAGLGAEDAADLQTLATSFRDLARTRLAPPPAAPVATTGTTIPEPASAASRGGGAAAAPAMLYDSDNPDVVAPVAIDQELPPLRVSRSISPSSRGLLVLVIDEAGRVESAVLTVRIHPTYDRMLLDRVKSWRYAPATLNGRAVRFRKVIEVRVTPE